MNSYVESKQKLDELRRNEMLFRMAISHLMDVGIRHLTEENIEKTCAEIMKEDDSHSFMTNEFQCALIRTVGELAKIDHIHLLNYISKEIYYDVGDGLPNYNRVIGLLKGCMNNIECAHDDLEYTLWDFEDIGFEDSELKQLGFGHLLEEEEEE